MNINIYLEGCFRKWLGQHVWNHQHSVWHVAKTQRMLPSSLSPLGRKRRQTLFFFSHWLYEFSIKASHPSSNLSLSFLPAFFSILNWLWFTLKSRAFFPVSPMKTLLATVLCFRAGVEKGRCWYSLSLLFLISENARPSRASLYPAFVGQASSLAWGQADRTPSVHACWMNALALQMI